ncbi:MAG: PQQ-dependent sugar dehydrogenase [Thermomicrobiales bacterium]
MKNWRLGILLFLICVGLILPVDAVDAAFTGLPAKFSDQGVITGVPSPTAIAWLPDGTLLATGKAGGVYRQSGGVGASILDISGKVCSGGEMGLLGLAVDPQFASGRRFLYVYYTNKRGSGCNDAKDRANRVSRFTMDGGGALTPSSELVLLDNIAAKGGNHNGGDIQFGSDGMLYIAVGDSGSDLLNGDGQDGNGNARRMDILNGKILRVTPDGAIPPDNPFAGSGSGICAVNGQIAGRSAESSVSAEKKGRKNKKAKKRKKRKQRERKRNQGQNGNPPVSSTRCGEIFATGLRNPYRIAFDPDATGAPRFFINDVGGGAWEEIDQSVAGADYGWNLREGPCKVGSTSDCASDARFVDPIHAYNHGTGCNVITGGAFVPNGSLWPNTSLYLYADFGCQKLFTINENNPATATQFASGSGTTHLAFGPDKQLYYTDYGAGAIRRIVYTP